MKRKILLVIFTLILVLTGITNTNAYDKYDGDYTLEYLLRNYNVVTLGTYDRYNYTAFDSTDKTKGSVTNVFDIGGPVLIRGNYTGSTNLKWDNEFAQKTNCVPSYIKGKIGDKIKAGSIESAELSNVYVGSSNKVTESDGYYTVNSDTYKYKYPVKVSDDYVDFDKLYASIVNEQKGIEKGTILKPTNFDLQYIINEPGFYTIDDIDKAAKIQISNYNPNKLYVITVTSKTVYSLPNIFVSPYLMTDGKEVYCGRTKQCMYTGNIIWNFPNARYIYANLNTQGHIIAPKADIELVQSHYPGTIIANSIKTAKDSYTAIQFYPYNLNDKIVSNNGKTLVEEAEEINNDDLYDGSYSIDELLKNYSVVTLGTKAYGSNTKLATLTDTKGTASIFHVVGQFLINGNLGVNSIDYEPGNYSDYSGVRLDFKNTELPCNSYIKGTLQTRAYQPFGYLTQMDRANKKLFVGLNNSVLYLIYGGGLIRSPYHDLSLGSGGLAGIPKVYYQDKNLYTDRYVYRSNNYIDFQTLYNAIVEQQKKIDEGTIVRPNADNEIHIPIGGNYTIEGINEASTILFDNYEENKNKLTIITIKDNENINLPQLFAHNPQTGDYLVTNDWYGKSKATYKNEFINEENYYGNIVWNIPNARYIKLAAAAPFVGHIIAPNADVETPELHFAGAMIANSLYTEGNTEAHFYPLTVGSVGTGIKKETKTIGGEVEKITISGTKTWDDNDNQDGVRPESVTINLLANGVKVESKTITEKDNWKYEFNFPRVDETGVKINYTITEDAIEHYSIKIESFSNDTCPSGCKVSIDGYNITNSYTPKKTSLTVNKVWKDENNADKLRPESVEVELYANGKRIDSAILNEENNWTYIFNEIDMYQNGEKIAYTVKETTKLKDYTTKISGDQETGYTITNTHVVKKDNPKTGDNIKKFLMISGVSALLLIVCLVIFTKYRKKKA